MDCSSFWSFLLIFIVTTVRAGNITILVGGTGFVFRPSNVTAAVGDLVNFIFLNASHSVTQSTFPSPCSLLQDPTTNTVGFDSGFMPVDPTAPEFPIWTLNVTDDTKPIWFYCKQGNHCQQGMVGSINAPLNGTNTFDAFRALAVSGGGAPPTTTLSSPTSTGLFVSVGSLSSIPASETTLAFTTGIPTDTTSALNGEPTSTYVDNDDGGMGGSSNNQGGSGSAPVGLKLSLVAIGLGVGLSTLFSLL